jgi:hypothetical protein
MESYKKYIFPDWGAKPSFNFFILIVKTFCLISHNPCDHGVFDVDVDHCQVLLGVDKDVVLKVLRV